jgi:glycosyltransferase involved in cell wall biosynthesis
VSARRIYRVLFVFDNLELSGADKVALDLIRLTAAESQHGIRARGFVCMADKTPHSCEGDDIEFANPGLDSATPIWKKPFLGLKAILRCVRAARNADLVVGVTPPSAFVAACVGILGARPAAAWVHYDINGWARELECYSRGLAARFFEVLFYRRIVPRFGNIVFVSTAALESMAASRTASPRHWTYIPNPFLPRAFAGDMPDLSRLVELKADGVPLLILLGRLTRQKRWGDAIRALELVSTRGPAPHLVVIGDGNERTDFLACATASPAAARIHWLRSLANPCPALAMGDALLLTSLYEAWPVVILEAFHARVPVIAYDCPSGPAELLAEGRGLCCPETPAAMAKSIEELLSMHVAERTKMLDLSAGFLSRHNNHEVLAQWKSYAELLAAPA